MYISKIKIENIRSFDAIELNFTNESGPIFWTTFLGDNSTGKTTLLRCIALGLCDESGAAGLLRESEEGYIRHSETKGLIEITLCDNKGKDLGKIRTTIKRKGNDKLPYENLRQETFPKNFNPWGNIFICGYGIGRGVSGTGDISGYSPISAVYNLFNYAEGLQNPELVIRRISKQSNIEFDRIAKKVLGLSESNAFIKLRKDGIKIMGGPFLKETSLRDVADGYKSTFQWISDFIGWAISYNSKNYTSTSIAGIVLIDAIEEHLHPKWQREIVQTLHKELFPKVQFIATSHSPLIASGTVDHDDAELIELERTDNNKVIKNPIAKNELKGMRADEVLRHDAFGLVATASLGSISDIQRYGQLIALGKRSKIEEAEFQKLKHTLKTSHTFGESDFERDVEKAVSETLKTMITNPTDAHFIEIKKQLRKLFAK